MNVGGLRHQVWLEDRGADDVPATEYAPAYIWAAIEPAPPGVFDEQRITHIVHCWYHPQITFRTVLRHKETRRLYVKGIQNQNEQDKELTLLCEEVQM